MTRASASPGRWKAPTGLLYTEGLFALYYFHKQVRVRTAGVIHCWLLVAMYLVQAGVIHCWLLCYSSGMNNQQDQQQAMVAATAAAAATACLHFAHSGRAAVAVGHQNMAAQCKQRVCILRIQVAPLWRWVIKPWLFSVDAKEAPANLELVMALLLGPSTCGAGSRWSTYAVDIPEPQARHEWCT